MRLVALSQSIFGIPTNRLIEPVEFEIDVRDYTLLVVDTGGDHADLTDDYAAIPREMNKVARALGKEDCRDIEYSFLLQKMNLLRGEVGDRALLRALHFLQENERVLSQVNALRNKDLALFLSPGSRIW